MTSTFFLIRHGQIDGNVTKYYTGLQDVDLNKKGYEQAHKLSTRLSHSPISAIYSSPLRRTLTTASIIAEPHGIQPKTFEDLIEINLGDRQGLYDDEIRKRWPDLKKQSLIDPSNITMPNGESFSQVTERAIRAFETIVSIGKNQHIAIVTHEIVVKVLVAYILGVSNSIYRKFEIGNASLTTIKVREGIRQLHTLNDISHL